MRALDECVIGRAVGLVFSTGAGVGMGQTRFRNEMARIIPLLPKIG